MLMREFPAALALVSSLSLSLALGTACGRTSPEGGTDSAEIDAVARLAAFDTEEELTVLLDDNYLAADTDLVDEAEVTAIATTIATGIATQTTDDAIALLPFNDPATVNDDLRAELDDTYLPRDTALLDVTDVNDAARDVCFDSELELVTELDDQYLRVDDAIDFADLVGVPAGLADGDDDTITAVTAPLELTGSTLAIDTNGCVNGEALVFQGGSFSCLTATVPATPLSASAVGAAAVNTRPLEALPIVIKTEVAANIAAANGTQDVVVYNATFPAPRNMLLVDAWAVANTVTSGAPSWHLREGGANDLTTEVLLGAPGEITRIGDFSGNVAQRSIAPPADQLVVRVTGDADGAVADVATFTVYILAIPL